MSGHPMFFSVEGDENEELFSFHINDAPPPPQAGDQVVYWIDNPDWSKRHAESSVHPDDLSCSGIWCTVSGRDRQSRTELKYLDRKRYFAGATGED